jgi:ATP-binding cassette subfamily B protein
VADKDDDEEEFRIRDLPRHLRGMTRSAQRAFELLWVTSPTLFVSQALLTVFSGALPGAQALVAKRILDAISRAIQTGKTADRDEVIRWIAIEFAMVIGSSVLTRAQHITSAFLRVQLGQRVNEMILEKALTLTLADFEDSKFQNRMTRARQGASYRPLDMVGSVFDTLRYGVVLATYGVLLWAVSPLIVGLIALAAIAEFVVDTRFRVDSFRLFRWRSDEARRQNYIEAVLTRDDHAKEVKLFGLGPMLLERYRGFFARSWKEDRDLTWRKSLWGLGLALVGSVAYYGSYAWVALDAVRRRISIGDVSLFAMVFHQGQQSIGGLLMSLGSLYEDHLYLGELFEYLDHPTTEPTGGGITVGPKPGDGIRFEHVSFSYKGSDKNVLDDVSLHLPAGRKLALVGENGAGKTTLVKLLTRLYTPTAGRILLDGADVDTWDLAALRKRIGVIFQDFVRYQFTVGENIGVGDIDSFADEARWREAASRGTADEFIDKLPKQYATQLGKWFDDGQELSIGQWQKIALSRAFMRVKADILVLDEPTASIDAAAEARIFERFQALAADRTAVLISHRFSTVRMADVIAVLAGGKIVEQGSHEELVARGGRYAELFFLQAKGYR